MSVLTKSRRVHSLFLKVFLKVSSEVNKGSITCSGKATQLSVGERPIHSQFMTKIQVGHGDKS